jgi:hypothetical protein
MSRGGLVEDGDNLGRLTEKVFRVIVAVCRCLNGHQHCFIVSEVSNENNYRLKASKNCVFLCKQQDIYCNVHFFAKFISMPYPLYIDCRRLKVTLERTWQTTI